MTPYVKLIETPQEMHEALAIRRQVFVVEQGVSLEEEVDGLDGQAHHFLMLLNDHAIGTARARQIRGFGENYVKAERVAVLPEFRGQGLGRLIMEAIEDWARQLSSQPSEVRLNAQNDVVPFYARQGYDVSDGDPFMEAGILHLAMSKRLH